MAKVALDKIYNRLNKASGYHPISADTFADWSMEAGDSVTISQDGTSYKSPVSAYTMKWNGSQTVNVNTGGSEKMDAISKLSATSYSSSSGGSSGMRGVSSTRKYEEETKAQFETRFNQTDTTIGMSVGKVKYTTVRKYASKSKFPKTGQSNILYHANDTGLDYVWIASSKSYHVAALNNGEANYVQIGEIALAFNEQTGQTEAKLDADVVYAGKNKNGKLVTLEDLELPDWMGATNEGIIALQGSFGTLNAKVANIEKLTANAITTDNLAAQFTNLGTANIATLTANSLYIKPMAGMGSVSVASALTRLRVRRDGNNYHLEGIKFNSTGWEDFGTFSRAITSVNWRWSNGTLIARALPQNQDFSYTPVLKFVAGGGRSFTAQIQDPKQSGAKKSIAAYLHENIDGENSTVTATENGGDDIASISTGETYNAGWYAGYPVSSNQVSGGNFGFQPSQAGEPYGRNLGTTTRPSQSGYIKFDIYVHGSTIPCYIGVS